MSQKAVESLLGRLLTDPQLRGEFYLQPKDACAAQWPDITPREINALLALDQSHLERFAKRLDPQIVRATVERFDQTRRRQGRSTVLGSMKLRAAK